MNTLWTDEIIDQLAKLWKEGHSAAQIAGMLGTQFTKNAVIGKVHRLKLSKDSSRQARPRTTTPKPKSTSNSGVSRTQRRNAKTLARTTIDQFHASKLHDEPVLDLSFVLQDTDYIGHSAAILGLNATTCKWPVGDPLSSEFRFCNASADGTYCAHHQNKAYRGNARVDHSDKRAEKLYA